MPEEFAPTPATPPGIRLVGLPVVVGLLLMVLVVILWRLFESQERQTLREQVRVETEGLAYQIEADIRYRFPSLVRMARRWELRGKTTYEEFAHDANALLTDVPGFQAVEWVDKGYYARWVIPLQGNEKAQDLYLAYDEKRRVAMERAKQARTPILSQPIDLVQGGKGLLAFFPIYVRGEFEGFVMAVFRIHDWLEYVFSIEAAQTENYRISVAFEETPVYRQEGWERLKSVGLESRAVARVLDHRLYVYVRPTDAAIQSDKTLVPLGTIILGTLLSLLVALVVYLLQKANWESCKATNASAALEVEVRQRKESEDTLARALVRTELATQAGGMGIWTWELATGALQWNDRMFELYGVPPDVPPTYRIWHDSLHPQDRKRAKLLLKSAVDGKAIFDTEFRIVLADQQVRHLRAAARVERDGRGKPRYVTGLNWDITKHRKTEEALIQSEGQVRLLLNSTGEAIYGIDLEGKCTFANPACARILGYGEPQALIGKNMHALIHHSYPDGRRMAMEDCRIFRAFREGMGTHADDERMWRADGTSFPSEYWSYPQRLGERICGAVVTFHDITERRYVEEQLATERRRLSHILEGTNVGTWEWNIETGETVFNERWAEIVGYTLEELAPISITTWAKLAHPDDLATSSSLLEKHFRGETPYYECEARMHHKDGHWVWVLDRGKVATRTDDGRPLMMFGTHLDITEHKAAEELIRHMAYHDELTGLPSLRLAKDRLMMAVGRARRQKTCVAVMFLDLDGFKAVNDTFGHDAGDAVLKEVAARLRSCVRETDTVARISGDEFLIIMAELLTPEGASRVAELVLQVIPIPINTTGGKVSVSASIGIAISPRDGQEVDRLIKLADEAMYQVKHSSKHGYQHVVRQEQ